MLPKTHYDAQLVFYISFHQQFNKCKLLLLLFGMLQWKTHVIL